MPLTRILPSQINENHVFVVTQEGHPVLLDRRRNYQAVQRLQGSRGSVRDACSILVHGENKNGEKLQRELIVTAGCDRMLRLFDPSINFRRQNEIAHIYLKQRLNSLWIPRELSSVNL